jgi:acyl carrier protein phosphodiesterase
MARQSQNKFIKRQKELERMRKAKEKMERRQSKKDKAVESSNSLTSAHPL